MTTSALMMVVSVPDTPTAAPLEMIELRSVSPPFWGVTLNGSRSSGPPGALHFALGLVDAPRPEPESTISGLNSAPTNSPGATSSGPGKAKSEASGFPFMYSWYGARHAARDSGTGE